MALADYILSYLFFQEVPKEGEQYTSNELAIRSAMTMAYTILAQLHTEDEAELAKKMYEEIISRVSTNYNCFGRVGIAKEVELKNSSGRSFGFIWEGNVYIIPNVFDEWTKDFPLSSKDLRVLLKNNNYLFTDATHNTKQARINFNGRCNGRYICLPYAKEAM